MEQQRDTPQEEDPGSVEEAGSPSFVERHFWPILTGIVLLAAGGGAVVVYMQYDQVDRTVRAVPYTDQAAQVASAIPYVGSADSSENGQESYGSFTRMDGLVVNPADSDGTSYLAVSIAFESKSGGLSTEMEKKKVVVKDTILTLLSRQKTKELSDPSRRDTLKDELIGATNQVLNGGTVDRLYFTEFVLQ